MMELAGQWLARRMPWLDKVGDALQPPLQKALAARLPLRNALDGTWLGAPLHPALTDLPVGATTVALVLDCAGAVTGSRRLASAADKALALGVAFTLPAAATGTADWRDLMGETRRVASLHALLNSTGLMLNVGSLLLRVAGQRRAGRAASAAGYAVSTLAAAHIGGELSYGLGVRVNQTPPASGPAQFTAVLDASAVQDGALRRVEVDGSAVLVSRTTDGAPCAIAAVCSHAGGPLEQGEREGDSVVCPWHGSRFDLRTGAVIDGPAVFALPSWDTREDRGEIEIRHVGPDA